MHHLARKPILIACLAVAPLAMAATDTRELPAFSGITSQGAYKLVVTVGPKQSVVLNGDADLLAKIKTTVHGDQLLIAMPEKTNIRWDDRVNITITVPQLNAYQFEGAGTSTLNNLSGEHFRLNYQGVGSLTATGQVQRFVLRAQGVGSLDAKGLNARHVDARLEGVGSAEVRASESLTAKVEGVGSLTYYGKPARMTKSVEGVGRVTAGD